MGQAGRNDASVKVLEDSNFKSYLGAKMIKVSLLILLSGATVFAQEKFDIKDASKIYDVQIEVERCEDGFCRGKLKVELFKKAATKPLQESFKSLTECRKL